MIYLFCNQGYGVPYVDAAIAWARSQSRGADLTVVYSGQRASLRAKLRCFLREVRFRSQLGLPLHIVDDVNDPGFRSRLLPGAHGIVAGFDQIFAEQTIACFQSLVNFHPSILPMYRGPVPSYWCVENGETMSGFTLHRVTTKIDAGEILYQEKVPIEGLGDPARIDQEIATRATATLERYLDCLHTGEEWSVQQVDASEVYRQQVDYMSFPGREPEAEALASR